MRREPRVRQLGRYEVLLELSRGGMGELYLARRHGAGGFAKLVAIKRILPHLASEPAFVELFQHEANIAAKLSHPNLCSVFELDESDGELALVMEYLDGVAWDVLAAATPPAEMLPLVAGVIGQACEGLHHAHAVPVIHRDVSPQNLFVTTAGVCKVLDFGVAKLANEGPRTRTGMLKGKLPYMAPEQIEGGEVDPRADVWSLGVVLWEALARRPLFDRSTDYQIWKAVTEEPVPALADQPAAINALIARATARPRDERFATARELGLALRAAVPPLDALAIADVVARRCGDRIAERAAAIAAATTPAATDDPSASATLVDAAETAQLRSQPIVIERPRSEAETRITVEPGPDAVAPARPATWFVLVGVLGVAVIIGVAVFATRHPDNAMQSQTTPALAASGSASASGSGSGSGSGSASASVSVSGSGSGSAAGSAARPVSRSGSSSGPGQRARDLGTLTVDSDPYAIIFVDGKRIGETPLFHIPIAAGKHRLRLVRADGTAQQRDIVIDADRDRNLGRITW